MTAESERESMSDESRIESIMAKAEGSSGEYRHDIEFLIAQLARVKAHAKSEALEEAAAYLEARALDVRELADRHAGYYQGIRSGYQVAAQHFRDQ